ncbi:unnamed protein product [Prunus brigantina]
MLFLGGQLREKGIVFSGGEGEPTEDKALFPIYRKVKVGGLHKVLMWDFVQVAVMVTRVLEIRFGS